MSEPAWLQISLEVDPEVAEAVSEALARYLPGGVVIESTAVEADVDDHGRAVGPLRVLGYIPVDAQMEATCSQIEQALRYLALIQPLPEPSYTPIQDANWMEAWKQHYRPLEIGKRLIVLPAWLDYEGARLPVRIDPGMAFGTGVHPTTQLSLQLIEDYLQAGMHMIDVGCGSGVLSIAAARLGEGPILGVDISAEAIKNARHNAQLNAVEIELHQASLEDVQSGRFSLQQAPLVAANILAPVLIRLLGSGLADLVEEGGVLVLSGILAEQESELRAALSAAGMQVVEERRIEDWLGLAAQRA